MQATHRKKLNILALFLFFILIVNCGKGCLSNKEDPNTLKPELPAEEIASFELMPKNLNVIAGMNITKVLSSPIGSKIQKQIPLIAQPFINEINEVVFGWSAEELGKGPESIIGILTGKFDTQKVEERLRQYAQKNRDNYQIEDYQAHKLYYFQEKPEETLSLIGNKVIIGHKDLVKQAIDLAKQSATARAKNSIAGKEDLIKQINNLDTKKMLWFTAIVPEKINPEDSKGNSHLEAVDLTVDFPAEVQFELGLVASSETDAKEMESQALSYQILFGKKLAEKDPNFGKAIENIKIEAKGNRLAISFALTQEQIQALENMGLTPNIK